MVVAPDFNTGPNFSGVDLRLNSRYPSVRQQCVRGVARNNKVTERERRSPDE